MLLLAYGQARAEFGYYGRLTTVIESYDTVEGKEAWPFYQYLNLTLNDPIKFGRDHYFYFYGRLATDINNKEDTESRIYSAFLNINSVMPRTDITAGRHFISTVAGTALTDGMELRFTNVGNRLNITLFAGGDVRYEEKYERGDMLFGGTLDVLKIPNTNLGLSFFQKDDHWDVARRAIGVDLGYWVKTLAKFHGEARYDLLSEMVDTYFLGGKLFIRKDLTLSLDYYYNVPVFDATDIYSVFAVEEYHETDFQVDYRVNPWISIFGAYIHEFYDEWEDTDRIELGALIRRYKSIDLYASALIREGEDDLIGGNLKGHYFFSNALYVGAGIEGDSYQRYDMESSKTASRYFMDLTYYLSHRMYLYAKVEGLKSVYQNHDIRARIKLSYAFQGNKGKGH